jgi:hypothetical protein
MSLKAYRHQGTVELFSTVCLVNGSKKKEKAENRKALFKNKRLKKKKKINK